MLEIKKILKPSIFIVLLVTVCIGAYKLAIINSEKKSTPAAQALVKSFHSINELVSSSDTIVVGTVQKVNTPFKVNKKNHIKKEDRSNLPDVNIVKTVSNVTVVEVLKGTLKEGSTIQVMQESGSGKNNEIDLQDVKIYKSGEQYIFLLRDFVPNTSQEIEDYKTEKFLPISPYQGQIKFKNNDVNLNENIIPEFNEGDSIDKIKNLLIEQISLKTN